MTPTVSADEIASYVVCPRQCEFKYRRQISRSEGDPDRIREERLELLREAVFAGLTADVANQSARVGVATDKIEEMWSSASYDAPAQETYDKSVVKAAIREYFERMGHDHAENLIGTEVTVTHTRSEIEFAETIDVLVERDQGKLAYNLRPTLKGVLQVSFSDQHLQEFLRKESNYRRQIATLVRAAVAIFGLRDEYGLSPQIHFQYVSLLEASSPNYEAGSGVNVTTDVRRFTTAVTNESSALRDYLESCGEAIVAGGMMPDDDELQRIIDRSCNYCSYQRACPEHIESQVSFTQRTREDESHEPSLQELESDRGEQ